MAKLWLKDGKLVYEGGKLCYQDTCPCICPSGHLCDGCVSGGWQPEILKVTFAGITGTCADYFNNTEFECVETDNSPYCYWDCPFSFECSGVTWSGFVRFNVFTTYPAPNCGDRATSVLLNISSPSYCYGYFCRTGSGCLTCPDDYLGSHPHCADYGDCLGFSGASANVQIKC